MNTETERIEFKSQMTDEIYKEIIAFATIDDSEDYESMRSMTQELTFTAAKHFFDKNPIA